jgi:hypothetical protein
MSKKVLFGLDERLDNLSNLKSYREIFKNISPVKFIGVFVADFVNEHVTHVDDGEEHHRDKVKRFASNVEIEVFADKNEIDYSLFRNGSNNEKVLITQSSFADLFLIEPYFSEDFFCGQNDARFKLIEQMQCPVYLHPYPVCQIKDVFILFDSKQSAVNAIKSFVTLFMEELKEKTVTTVFSISPETEDEIEQEKYLINYLIGNFENVGIQVTDEYSLEKDMLKSLRTSESPIIILGDSGFDLICNTKILEEIHTRKIPVFFAN